MGGVILSYKVSVIVPIFNGEKLIVSCLDSIWNQTIESMEIICINDGSSDQTMNVLENYESQHPDTDKKRIKIIDKENGGPSSARNVGIDIAEGTYIGFVDADDYIEPEMYKCLIDIADEKELDVVLCNILNCYSDGRKCASQEKVPTDQLLNRENILRMICPTLMREDVFGGPCNRIYRRTFIEKFHIRMPNDIGYGEDAVFQMQVFDHLERIWFDSHCYYRYIHREGSQSSVKPARFKNTLEPLYVIRRKYGRKWGVSNQDISNYFVYCTIMDIVNTLKSEIDSDKKEYMRYLLHNKNFFEALQLSDIKKDTYTLKIWLLFKLLKYTVRRK